MAVRTIENYAKELGIEANINAPAQEELKGSSFQQRRGVRSLEEYATQLDIAPASPTQASGEAQSKKRRGLFELLTTGEYFGVGAGDKVGKYGQDAVRQVLEGADPAERLAGALKLVAAPLTFSVAGLKGGVQGVRDKQTLAGTVTGGNEEQLGTKSRFALDVGQIFFDPTMYFSLGGTKIAKGALVGAQKLPGIGKGIEKITDSIGERFVYQYKLPDEYKQRAAERLVRISRGQEAAEEMAKNLTKDPNKRFWQRGRKFTLEEQRVLGDIIAGEITNADPRLVSIAEPAIDALERLGKDAVETGLMTTDTFLERARKYMPRLYRDTQLGDNVAQGFASKNAKIKGDRFKMRADQYAVEYKESLDRFAKPIMKTFGQDKDAYVKFVEELREKGLGKMITKRVEPLTEAAMKEKGLIEEAAYPVAKGIRDLTADIETAKFFKFVNSRYAQTADDIGEFGVEGLTQLPDAKNLGELAGKWVPDRIAKDINVMIEPAATGAAKLYNRLLNTWKVGKTVLNPAYHGRNMLSNVILNDVNGVSIFDPRGAKAYGQAIKELKQGGQYYDEAREAGLLGKTFYGEDLKDFIDPLESYNAADNIGQWIMKGGRKTAQLGGNFQAMNEDIAKLAHFVYKRNRGESVESAVESANKALFDYSALTNVEKKIKKYIPFYTFQRKAYPMLLGVAIDNPGRIGKYNQLKEAIENMSPESEDERNWLPEWMRDEFKVRLPMKDKDGNSIYFDATYIIPYGDVASNFTQDGLEGVARQFALMMTPILKEGIEQGLGKDLYFDKDIEMFRNQKAFGTFPVDARLGHAIRTFAPQIYTDFFEKLVPALQGDVDYAGREKGLLRTLGGMTGLKTESFDVEKAKESLPYELGKKLDDIEQNIYQTQKDKSLSPEDRERELQKWTKERQKVLDEYPGVQPKKRIWIDSER